MLTIFPVTHEHAMRGIAARRPNVFSAFLGLAQEVMAAAGGLSKLDRELVGAHVSKQFGCSFCHLGHVDVAEEFGGPEARALVDASTPELAALYRAPRSATPAARAGGNALDRKCVSGCGMTTGRFSGAQTTTVYSSPRGVAAHGKEGMGRDDVAAFAEHPADSLPVASVRRVTLAKLPCSLLATAQAICCLRKSDR